MQCIFSGNTLSQNSHGAAIIEASARNGTAQVKLEGCKFSGNTPSTLPTLLADNRGADAAAPAFFSDSPSPSVCEYIGDDWDSMPPTCDTSMTYSPWPLGDAIVTGGFLTASSAWFMQVQQVTSTHPPNLQETTTVSSGKKGLRPEVIASTVIAVVMAVLVMAAAAFVLRRRRKCLSDVTETDAVRFCAFLPRAALPCCQVVVIRKSSKVVHVG